MSEPIMQFFEYAHLPPHLQAVSRPFCELAKSIVGDGSPAPDGVLVEGVGLIEPLPRNPERTVALRKLLEAKDAAVRALLSRPQPLMSSAVLSSPAVESAPAASPTVAELLAVIEEKDARIAELFRDMETEREWSEEEEAHADRLAEYLAAAVELAEDCAAMPLSDKSLGRFRRTLAEHAARRGGAR